MITSHIEETTDKTLAPALAERPWWLWWNVLCMDAPTVALGWHLLSTRVAGVNVGLLPAVLLFVTVWSIYVVDHWLDSRRRSNVFARHLFMHGRGGYLVFVAVILCACGALISTLPLALVRKGSLLMGFVVIYMLAAHLCTAKWPREIFVGIAFAAGSLLTAFSFSSQCIDVVSQFALLAGVCVLNCVIIESREAMHSDELNCPARWMSDNGGVLGISLAAVAAALAVVGIPVSFAAAIATSALLLSLLSRVRWRIRVDAFRILADAALMTPYVALCTR